MLSSKERLNSLDSTSAQKEQSNISPESKAAPPQKIVGDSLTSGELLGDESLSNSLNFDFKHSEDSSSQNRENSSLLDMNISNFIDKNVLFGMSAISNNAPQAETDTKVEKEENLESLQDQDSLAVDGDDQEAVLETRFSAVELDSLNQMNNALLELFPIQGAANNLQLHDHSSPSPTLQRDQIVSESRLSLEGKEIDVGRWAELLKLESARELFLQELDEQRGRRAHLGEVAFRSMGNAMKVGL